MKRTFLILTLALALTLPLLGLVEAPAASETEVPAEEILVPQGRQAGRRWNMPGQDMPTPPAGRFIDENNDGVCDLCGNEPGKNAQAPGFVDENNDGVCDHFGTDAQRQGPMGRLGMGRHGMRRPGTQAPGRCMQRMTPGQGFTPPAFNNRNFGPGRNRR